MIATDDLITFLRDKTHLARLTLSEVRQVIEQLETEGYVIEKKIVAEVAPPAALPVLLVPIAPTSA